MSYPMSLDDYTDDQLAAEIARRTKSRKRGLCDYCKRRPSLPPCRFPERHYHPAIIKAKVKP